MTSKIKELVEQAGFGSYAEIPDTYIVHKNDLVEFAELIVRECLDIVANADMTMLEGPDPEDVLYVACLQVKEHFGVEE